MLLFEGDKILPRLPAEAWAKLSDARFLVQCIPNAEVVGTPDAALAVCKLRPGFAFVRGTLDVTLHVVETTEPSHIRLNLFSKAIGASAELEASMILSGVDKETQVQWKAEVKSLGGLLKLVPQGLIRGAAQSVINDVWKQVEAKI